MYYTYLLKSKADNQWYTGYTGDLRKRLKEHSEGTTKSTKNRGPFELIYYEACLNEDDAKARERYLKSGIGKRYLKNRLKRFLTGKNYEKNRQTTSLQTQVCKGMVINL